MAIVLCPLLINNVFGIPLDVLIFIKVAKKKGFYHLNLLAKPWPLPSYRPNFLAVFNVPHLDGDDDDGDGDESF